MRISELSTVVVFSLGVLGAGLFVASQYRPAEPVAAVKQVIATQQPEQLTTTLPPGFLPSSVMFVDAGGSIYARYGIGVPGVYPRASFRGPIPYTEAWRNLPQPVLIHDPYHSFQLR